jgi:hypothetical protein
LENVRRKESDMVKMFDNMVIHMRKLMEKELNPTMRTFTDYNPVIPMEIPGWLS